MPSSATVLARDRTPPAQARSNLRPGALSRLVVYCADIGSIKRGNFGWARSEIDEDGVEQRRGSIKIIGLAEAVVEDLADRSVALRCRF